MMMNIFKKKDTLPKIHWGDITIAKHKAIIELYEKQSDMDDYFFACELVRIVYDKSEEWINGLKISEANDYINSLAFINERPKPNVAKKEYVINGHKYVTTFNMQNLTTAQYIDFQQLADKSGEMPAEFLSILLVPEGKKYNEGYNLEDVVNDIRNYMSVEDCLGLSAFFFTLLQVSMKRSIRKLGKIEKKAKKEGLMNQEQLDALKRVRELLESANGLRR